MQTYQTVTTKKKEIIKESNINITLWGILLSKERKKKKKKIINWKIKTTFSI